MLNVSGLKFFCGIPWATYCLSNGLESIKKISEHLLFKSHDETSSVTNNNQVPQQQNNFTNNGSPIINSPINGHCFQTKQFLSIDQL